MKKLFKFMTIVSAVAATGFGGACAESFPTRPVKIVVPFPPGGGVDVLVRALGRGLSERWGQPVVIENRPGAGTVIGTGVASRAAPDGYTLLATTSQSFTTNRFLYKNLPYNPDNSFVPVSALVKADQFIVAHASVPANDLRQLAALARDKPGSVSYGSWGAGSEPQLTLEYLKKRERLDITHVPYQGVAPVLQALSAGQIQLTVASGAVAGPLIASGKIKALAVAGDAPSTQFPAVPTTSAAGFPYLRAAINIGLYVPAGTPPAVLEKLGKDVRGLLNTPAFGSEHVASKGFSIVASTGPDAQALLQDETTRLKEAIEAAGIKAE